MKIFQNIKLLSITAFILLMMLIGCKDKGTGIDAPEVVSTSPTEVERNKVIEITFNEEMNAATINTSIFTVSQGSANISGSIEYSGTTTTFTAENSLTAVTDYTATITTGAENAAGRSNPDFVELHTGEIGGKTLTPGLYKWSNTVLIASNVTISGGADDVWIFQIAENLTMSSAVNNTLSGGAQARNIFWQVAGEVKNGATSHFEGIILSMTGIILNTDATLNGRVLAQTAAIFGSNTVNQTK